MALYPDLTAEIMDQKAEEGIPYMQVHGLWARIVIDDVMEFCRLYGYTHGVILTTVRAYGGFIWKRYPPIPCLLTERGSLCTNETELQDQWFDGPYVACSRNASLVRQGATECM